MLTALRGAEHPAISSVVSAVSEMKLTAPASTASWAKAFVVAAGDDQHAAVGEPAPELCGQGDAVAVLEPYVGEDQLGAVALIEGDGVLGPTPRCRRRRRRRGRAVRRACRASPGVLDDEDPHGGGVGGPGGLVGGWSGRPRAAVLTV